MMREDAYLSKPAAHAACAGNFKLPRQIFYFGFEEDFAACGLQWHMCIHGLQRCISAKHSMQLRSWLWN